MNLHADTDTDRPIVLEVSGLSKVFRARRTLLTSSKDDVHAATDVSLTMRRGETLALVGESGSGKSTVARMIAMLERPDSGSVEVLGQDWTSARPRTLRRARRQLQMIFQDPFASLDPMKMVVFSIGEPLMIHQRLRGSALDRRVLELLEQVGLPSNALHRYPHEFSGGQRQRIAIARALAAEPAIVVADEAVSALDVSTQAQILNLMKDIQQERGLAFLFITHDLGVVRQIADRVTVMHHGEIVEEGPADLILETPRMAYTRRLLAAVPEVSAHDRQVRRSTLIEQADE